MINLLHLHPPGRFTVKICYYLVAEMTHINTHFPPQQLDSRIPCPEKSSTQDLYSHSSNYYKLTTKWSIVRPLMVLYNIHSRAFSQHFSNVSRFKVEVISVTLVVVFLIGL